MEKENRIAKIVNLIIKIFWIFVIGSVFGFFAEMLYGAVYTRTFVIRRGLIYGPFIQVYGMGAIAYYLLIAKVKEPKEAFFSGMIMGGILEYICSFFQEILFGTISWDYSNQFLNFNGRTCLLYCFYWGIIAVVFLKTIYPWFEKMELFTKKKSVRILTVFLMLFMTFDITISCMAGSRQNQRHRNVPAKNSVDVFLDNRYPDEYLDRIYDNKKEIK
ncbi:MAG: putative ABC transporter permease [Clostridia bacterium]|nr:putative ABC transporter permease [Clostridia bacterium]